MRSRTETPETDAITPGQHAYYVTVVDGSRVGWLAGPFNCRARADEKVQAAKTAAGGDDQNNRAWWYGYGVTRIQDATTTARVVFPHL